MNTADTIFVVLIVVVLVSLIVSISVIEGQLQNLINIIYENLIQVILLFVLLTFIPLILRVIHKEKKHRYELLLLADGILIAAVIGLMVFPYTYAILSSNYESAELTVNVNIPVTLFGQTLPLTQSYSISSVLLRGYYPNTAFGSEPISLSILNGNQVYIKAVAMCDVNGSTKAVSSGEVSEVFPSFTIGSSFSANITVPNVPDGDQCYFGVYLINSHGNLLSNEFTTTYTEVSLQTPAQETSSSSNLPILLVLA